MIDKKVAAALADRFSGLNWYPREGPAQIELIQAVETAENEFIGTYVVNEWIKYEPECPKPSEIRSLIRTENAKLYAAREQSAGREEAHRRANCPDCHDFGIVESIRGAPIESVCRYCDCRSGQQRKGRIQFDEYNPDAINAARQKLLKLSGKNAAMVAMFRKTTPTKIFGDDYHGEF